MFEVNLCPPSLLSFHFLSVRSHGLPFYQILFHASEMAPKHKAPSEDRSAVLPLEGRTLIFRESDVSLLTLEHLGEAVDPLRCCLPESNRYTPAPQAGEVVVFQDVFEAGLRFLFDSVIVDILDHFKIRLHQLTPDAFVQLSLYLWVCKTTGIPASAKGFAFTHRVHKQPRSIMLVREDGSEARKERHLDVLTSFIMSTSSHQ